VLAVDESLLTTLRTIVSSEGSRVARGRTAVAAIRNATAAQWVGLYSVTSDRVTNEAWIGPAAPAHPTFGADQGLTAHAIAAGAVAVSNDVQRDPRYLANQADSGSELIVPIIRDGRVVGTLDVEDDCPGAFDGAAFQRYERLAEALRPLWDPQ
jgi:putative methionine-R-sulfoxide reductase with GAF domain